MILTPLPQTSATNTINNSTGMELGGEGRCELLTCLPHPASLISYRGAQLFVVKTRDSVRPPPVFTPTLGEELLGHHALWLSFSIYTCFKKLYICLNVSALFS